MRLGLFALFGALSMAPLASAAPQTPADVFADAFVKICAPAVRKGAPPTEEMLAEAGFTRDETRVGMAVNPTTGRAPPPYPEAFGSVFYADVGGAHIWGYANGTSCAVRVNGAEGAFEAALEALRHADPVWARAIRFADAKGMRDHDVEIEAAFQGRRLVASLGAFRGRPYEPGAGSLFSSARLEAVDWDES